MLLSMACDWIQAWNAERLEVSYWSITASHIMLQRNNTLPTGQCGDSIWILKPSNPWQVANLIIWHWAQILVVKPKPQRKRYNMDVLWTEMKHLWDVQNGVEETHLEGNAQGVVVLLRTLHRDLPLALPMRPYHKEYLFLEFVWILSISKILTQMRLVPSYDFFHLLTMTRYGKCQLVTSTLLVVNTVVDLIHVAMNEELGCAESSLVIVGWHCLRQRQRLEQGAEKLWGVVKADSWTFNSPDPKHWFVHWFLMFPWIRPWSSRSCPWWRPPIAEWCYRAPQHRLSCLRGSLCSSVILSQPTQSIINDKHQVAVMIKLQFSNDAQHLPLLRGHLLYGKQHITSNNWIWVFPKMVVPPKQPKMVIFSRKTNI